jgi:hypothetical protein
MAAGQQTESDGQRQRQGDQARDYSGRRRSGRGTLGGRDQAPGGRPAEPQIDQSVGFFKQVFRADAWYERFPIASVFTPDFARIAANVVAFVSTPANHRNLVAPGKIPDAAESVASYMTDWRQWGTGGFNHLMLNSVLAPNPVVWFWISLTHASAYDGLSEPYQPDSPLFRSFEFERQLLSNPTATTR